MKWILCCIDGTSSAKWRKKDGSNSHVHRFYRNFGRALGTTDCSPLYLNGPNDVSNGSDTPSIKEIATRHIRNCIKWYFGKEQEKAKSHDFCRIVLIGHSRGGGISIDLAKELKNSGIQVYFMGLFDAVDWSSYISGGTVTNVKYAYHALRGLSYSRSYFGNVGISGTIRQRFNTSHGGVGGDVVTDPKFTNGWFDDRACTIQTRVTGIYPVYAGTYFITTEKSDDTSKRVAQCKSESLAAYNWIANRARVRGLPI